MIDPKMDSGFNSTEIEENFDLVMGHDMVCGLMILALTLIIMCIFCTYYKIAVDSQFEVQPSANQINIQGIIAPPNSPIPTNTTPNNVWRNV